MTISNDGAEIHYTTYRTGAGPTCVVLSAIGVAPYERQIRPSLGKHFSLVFVDLRGGGESSGSPADLTFDQLARDLEAVRRDVGADRVAVLGHSITGALAVEYGRRCPSAVSHVLAVSTPPRGNMAALAVSASEFFARDASPERKQILADNLSRLAKDAPFQQVFMAQAPTRFFDPRVDMAPWFAGAISKPGLLAHLMGELLADWDAAVAAASLRVPLWIAHGRYDYTVPYVMWDGVRESLPAAGWQRFERSGHQPFGEEPEEFRIALQAWLEAH